MRSVVNWQKNKSRNSRLFTGKYLPPKSEMMIKLVSCHRFW